jgi:hypothetical protein
MKKLPQLHLPVLFHLPYGDAAPHFEAGSALALPELQPHIRHTKDAQPGEAAERSAPIFRGLVRAAFAAVATPPPTRFLADVPSPSIATTAARGDLTGSRCRQKRCRRCPRARCDTSTACFASGEQARAGRDTTGSPSRRPTARMFRLQCETVGYRRHVYEPRVDHGQCSRVCRRRWPCGTAVRS